MAGRALIGAAILLALLAPASAGAQPVEVAPLFGYRLGDVDASPAIGVVLDVPLWEGSQIEGLFTHQAVGGGSAVDHWLGGVLQELDVGAVRPFVEGTLGLTRYAWQAEQEFRFAAGAGGGVKVFPFERVGVRLDGRVFATVIDAETVGGICGGRGCLVGLHVNVAWQVEFSAGLIVRLGPVTPRRAKRPAA